MPGHLDLDGLGPPARVGSPQGGFPLIDSPPALADEWSVLLDDGHRMEPLRRETAIGIRDRAIANHRRAEVQRRMTSPWETVS